MFIPHTSSDREEMLRTIGVESIEDLFRDLPNDNLYPELKLPAGESEMEAFADLDYIASANEPMSGFASFLGAGAYRHYIPAAVDAILQRGEFYTAYTPYQPEISQGTLQAIFEYQSLITALTGMDVSNASHYDGATAVAEAVNMAYHNFRGKRSNVVLSPSIHPQYRETVHTYFQDSEIRIVGENISYEAEPNSIVPLIDENTALVMVQYPDFFGRVYDFTDLGKATHGVKALFGVHVNPISLGLLKPPGEFGADIVTGEGQSLGIPISYGGPYLGIFATRNKYARKIAGRLVGETIDTNGQRGYVLTLSTREQHIRRERASSNICTNQSLMALASTLYLSLLGRTGLRKVAELCYHKAHYTAEQIAALPGFDLWSDAEYFNEFVIQCPRPVCEINEFLLENSVLGGYDLIRQFPEFENLMLIAVTELNTREDIDYLVELLQEVSNV